MKRWLLVGLMLVAAQAMALMYEWRDPVTHQIRIGETPPPGVKFWKPGDERPEEATKRIMEEQSKAAQAQRLRDQEIEKKQAKANGTREASTEKQKEKYPAWPLFAAAAFIYCIPAVTAYSRKHRNSLAILWLNILTGWTGLGWLVAFIWALTK